MSIASRLKVKYGLPSEPSAEAIKRFKRQALANIRTNEYTKEEAGRRAAALIFTGFGTHVYASQSDTLEMLLRDIED